MTLPYPTIDPELLAALKDRFDGRCPEVRGMPSAQMVLAVGRVLGQQDVIRHLESERARQRKSKT